jgi:hypothetical protein
MFIRRNWSDPDTYDSTFAPAAPGRPATLTITLRVALIPRDPTGGRGTLHLAANSNDRHYGLVKDGDKRVHACQSWLVNEWVEFKNRFKYMVELVWNNQIILLPPEGLDEDIAQQLVSSPHAPAHIRCAFRIVRVSEWQPDDAHAAIEAVLLKQPNMEASQLKKLPPQEFRSFHKRLCNKDVYFEHNQSNYKNRFLYQCTAAHEVGHWLHQEDEDSFGHVDEEYCAAHPDADNGDGECEYGHNYATERAIMGSGTVATSYEAIPWLKRMTNHVVGGGDWTYIHRIDFERLAVQSAGRT